MLLSIHVHGYNLDSKTEVNIQFSEVWRPAERVDGQRALALLPLRLALLLQVPAGQIQAAVNLPTTRKQRATSAHAG